MAYSPINRDAWRAQVQEVALDPDLPIIDAHHHLWPDAPPVSHFESYTVEDLVADKVRSGHNIIATVFVEAAARYRIAGPEKFRPVGQTEYIDQVARDAIVLGGGRQGLCMGIVATADMMLGPSVEEVLTAHLEASPTRMRGIRYLTANDIDFPFDLGTYPHMLSDPRFRAAVACLKPLNLSLDVFVFHPQLPEVARLAEAFPDTTIILNHIGGPMGVGRYAGGSGFDEWRTSMRIVARNSNVYVKLGGLNMEYTGLGSKSTAATPWTSAELANAQRAHFLATIDLFGPKRCMFESNFPVDRMNTSATVLWNTFKHVTRAFSAAEKLMLFRDTAKLVYRLDADESGAPTA